MGTYFRLCRISRLRFFRAWKIEILEFIQILHLAEAPMPPLPLFPLTCRFVSRGLGVLLSQHFIVIIYILHLFCFFAALALKLQLKKMKAHFAACFSRLSSNFN